MKVHKIAFMIPKLIIESYLICSRFLIQPQVLTSQMIEKTNVKPATMMGQL